MIHYRKNTGQRNLDEKSTSERSFYLLLITKTSDDPVNSLYMNFNRKNEEKRKTEI